MGRFWRVEGKANGNVCLRCGKALIGRQREFCSVVCGNSWRHKQEGKPYPSRSKVSSRSDENPQWRVTCLWCGRILTGRQRRYCSDNCELYWARNHNPSRKAAYKVRNARYENSPKGQKVRKAIAKRYRLKPETQAAYKEWCKNNPDKVREYSLRYIKTEKGKAALRRRYEKYGGNLCYQAKRAYLIFGLNKPCEGCGETDKSKLQCDHILPRALGGSDDIENLQVLCKGKCHKEKTSHDRWLIKNFKV